jgi:excisionase family DNA binding protein
VSELLGLSLNATYAMLQRGDIPSLKAGAKWLIPRVALHRMLGETTGQE